MTQPEENWMGGSAGAAPAAKASRERQHKEVVILQFRLTHYRIPLYRILRGLLRDQGVVLRLLYSTPDDEPDRGNLIKKLYSDLSWGERIPSKVLPFGFVRQPIIKRTRNADLVIVSDGTKHMLNYAPYLLPLIKAPKIAFWGHGWNHHTDNPESWPEHMKFWLAKHVDWYFAYTWKVRERLIERGYDEDRVTDVQNAVEGPSTKVGRDDIARLRAELGLAPDALVAFYCGKMYDMKRLDLLIEAAQKARAELPSLVLILAGAGSDQKIAEQAARDHDFIHYVGPVLDRRKAAFYALSRLVVMPGLVGLGVVEAFHFGVPPIATVYPYHSPEIVYLRDGVNSLIVEGEADALAAAMVNLARDDVLHARLAAGCAQTAQTVTVEEMARRFADGILRALESPPR